MRKFSRRTTIVSVGMALVVATSVIAYAFWTTGGSGVGSAQAGTSNQNLTVNQTTPITGLTPGGTPATISGNFDNPNPSPVHVNQVTATISSVTPGSEPGKPLCTAADFDLISPAVVNADIPVGPGQGSWTGITIQLKETGLNQDNCKSAVVGIAYGTN